MNTLKRIGSVVTCILFFGYSLHAQSRLIGDSFEFSAGNLPTSFGTTFDPELEPTGFDFFDLEILETGGDDWGGDPVVLKFDGIAEEAGNIIVNERVVPWSGVDGGIFAVQAAGIDDETEFDLIDWENEGEVVEFSFQTKDGSWPAAEIADHTFYTLVGLDWANSDPNESPEFFQQGFYFYYSSKGVATKGYEMQLPQTALLVGKHPFDDSIEEVVYIGYGANQVEQVTKPYDGGFHLTGGTTQLDANASLAVLLGAMGLEPTDQDAFHWGFLVRPPEGSVAFENGDVNQDGIIDEADINVLSEAVRNASVESRFDVNSDSLVNAADRDHWINSIMNSFVGDANLDGEFNSGDLVKVFEAGKFETDQPAIWSEGDWDGDARFGSGDFVLAFQAGAFEQGPRVDAIVPEPNSIASALFVLTLLFFRNRASSRS